MQVKPFLVGVVTLLAGLVPAVAATAAPLVPPPSPAATLAIASVSNPHPDMISGGEVLLRITTPTGVKADTVRVRLDGTDVTAAFELQPDGTLLGLVKGLRLGTNLISADANRQGQSLSTRLRIRDYPSSGPVFSGSQQEPYICQTTSFGLAASVPPLCSAPTKVSYQYKDTAGVFLPLADPNTLPENTAKATVNGRSVPYVIRLEQGTIDRAVYQFAALWDGNDPSPLHQDTSWNQRLIYTFGGGCDAGFHQGTATGGVTGPGANLFLSQGYAVASSTLNVLDNNCNIVLSAEAAMMVKEHFIDTYGPVVHTIGWGGSGGSIQQYQIADAYPGILDGIIPGYSFPSFAAITEAADCRLLDDALGANIGPGGPNDSFTLAQKETIAGFTNYASCTSADGAFANRIQATASCDPSITAADLWNPTSNPDGIKCSVYEQNVTELGVNARTGFANSFFDNVGVQYGLDALLAGKISAAQFSELNATIGGFDYQGNPVPQRSTADLGALRAMYADDLIMNGGLGLRTTPIIDQRVDFDQVAGLYAFHTTNWSYVTRQRMIEAGDAGNQVIIENGPTATVQNAYELAAMNAWLDNIGADRSSATPQRKVASDKPAGLGDGCFLPGSTSLTLEKLSYQGSGACAAAYPVSANPRLIAGQPLDLYSLKCQLVPLSQSDYPGITFTAAEWAQLRSAFPGGVCNYNKPGVGEVAPRGTWLSYGT